MLQQETPEIPGVYASQIATSNRQEPTQALKAEPEKIYNITIIQLDRGYQVSVGCRTFAIATDTELIHLLSVYILKPAETQKLYFEGKLFSK